MAVCLYSSSLSLVVAGTAEVGSLVVAAVVTMVVVVGGLSGSDYPNWQSFESVPATFSFSNSRMFFCHFCGSSFREVCRKSKWKFKMAFAMKGGLEGVSFAIKLF